MKSFLLGIYIGSLLIFFYGVSLLLAQDGSTGLPQFSMWVECIERGPYPGRAVADVSYRYDGQFAVAAEDSRYFGDTETGGTIAFSFSIQPGEHPRDARINVGALKVVTWKVVLFDELHVLTVWDDPEIVTCPWAVPTVEPTPSAPDV